MLESIHITKRKQIAEETKVAGKQAIEQGKRDIAKMKQKKDAERKASLDNALLRACRKGDMISFRAAVDKGANINCTGSNLDTPAMVAAANGEPDILELLFQLGADMEARSSGGICFFLARELCARTCALYDICALSRTNCHHARILRGSLSSDTARRLR